jgi:uncharacterized protein (TIGR00255 family)
MIRSMTGFAALEREIADGILIVELRSVNHRYLELQLKLDDNVRIFEPLVRELISARMGRGKVECRISLMQRPDTDEETQLSDLALQRLRKVADEIHKQFPQSAPLTIAEILRWPGVLISQDAHHEVLAQEIRSSMDQVLQDMGGSREREGTKLKAMVLERLAGMRQIIEQVKPLLPQQIKAYQEKLTSKLREALQGIGEERIAQEIAIFAQRIDVDEELTRLTAHMGEVERILADDAAAGKRLDFLMQELNREANTLGSKSVSIEVSRAAMELKVLIEQMREQIQNIE